MVATVMARAAFFTIHVALLLVGSLSAGCSRAVLLPALDGADVGLLSVTRKDGDVAVTLTSEAWKGEPYWLGQQFTPIYVVVENHGSSSIVVGPKDFVALDEQRTQYSTLTPDSVAARVQSLARFYTPPPPPPLFYMGPFGRLWRYDWWTYPYDYYRLPNTSMIYGEALPSGAVRPQARVQGFVYFTLLPSTPQQITISMEYERADGARRQITFPFLIQKQ